MTTFNVHAAKTQFSKLIDRAVNGEDVVIAKAGKPMVRLVPIDTTEIPARRFGFLRGQISFPDDIDTGFNEEIEKLFGV